jgi:beta-glucosidase
MAPSDFAKADIDEIVEKLTVEETILLTAGVGFWYTHKIDRLGVPAIKVSGESYFSVIYASILHTGE